VHRAYSFNQKPLKEFMTQQTRSLGGFNNKIDIFFQRMSWGISQIFREDDFKPASSGLESAECLIESLNTSQDAFGIK